MRQLFGCLTMLLAAAGAFAAPAAAQGRATVEPFTEARFSALQTEGALVLVDVSATWCPTCAKQHLVLNQFRATHPNIPLRTLTVDFDTQKEWVRHFRAPRQSTFILFRGKEQKWFAVAETRTQKITEEILAAAK